MFDYKSPSEMNEYEWKVLEISNAVRHHRELRNALSDLRMAHNALKEAIKNVCKNKIAKEMWIDAHNQNLGEVLLTDSLKKADRELEMVVEQISEIEEKTTPREEMTLSNALALIDGINRIIKEEANMLQPGSKNDTGLPTSDLAGYLDNCGYDVTWASVYNFKTNAIIPQLALLKVKKEGE